MGLNDIDILVITPHYRWFVKDIIEAKSKFVGDVNVIIHHNYLAEISNYLPFCGYLEVIRQYTKDKIIDIEGKPDNVNIHLLSMLYFIPDGSNFRIGDKIAKNCEKYIKTQKIEFGLIHAHFTYPQGYAAIKLGRKYNVPVVITLHENIPHLNSLLKKYENKVHWTWKNADALIRVNKRDFPIYLNAGVSENKLHHIPNGFNNEKFSIVPKEVARKKLNFDPKKKIILTITRLSEEKGLNYLIESMKSVFQKYQNALCLIGGTGPLKEQLRKQIKKIGLEENVQLCGYIPNDKIAYYMNAADIFVLPSLSEGNPTVMFEALGVGLPFIGTNVGGIPEIITSEDYGLIVEPANPKDLTEKILKALEKKWDNKRITMYAKIFSWENIAKQTIDIYKILKCPCNKVNK